MNDVRTFFFQTSPQLFFNRRISSIQYLPDGSHHGRMASPVPDRVTISKVKLAHRNAMEAICFCLSVDSQRSGYYYHIHKLSEGRDNVRKVTLNAANVSRLKGTVDDCDFHRNPLLRLPARQFAETGDSSSIPIKNAVEFVNIFGTGCVPHELPRKVGRRLRIMGPFDLVRNEV